MARHYRVLRADMAIAFPTFEDTFCQMVGMCSHIKEALSSLPSTDIEMISSYRAHPGEAGMALVRLVWNPAKEHLHVDFALRTAFGENPPKSDTHIAKFRKTLARFHGVSVTVYPHGYFLIPLRDLPSMGGLIFVNASGVRLSAGQTEIELTGATLTFRRSAIQKLRWDLFKDLVAVDMEAKRRDLIISDSYLTDALDVFNAAVSTYILGAKVDGEPRA